MTVRIEKELCNPVKNERGYAEVPGPHYHIYKVDESGKKELVKTVDGDIKEAAREAERLLDLNVLEVAYKEHGPDHFKSTASVPFKVKEIHDDTILVKHPSGEKIVWGDLLKTYTPSEEQLSAMANIAKVVKQDFIVFNGEAIPLNATKNDEK